MFSMMAQTPRSFMNEQETAFMTMRQTRTNHAWSAITGKSNKGLFPRAAIALSGGGLRAAIASQAFTCALEEMGLLELNSYISTLSGSSWFLTSWLHHNLPLTKQTENLRTRVNKKSSLHHLINAATSYYPNAYQHNALCLQWGTLIGSLLIEEDLNKLKNIALSSLTANLDATKHPYPLFSSIISNSRPYSWIEFSLHEVRAYNQLDGNDSRIPINQFYSRYNSTQEENIAFMLSLFSSAHTAKPRDVYERIQTWLSNPTIPKKSNIFPESFRQQAHKWLDAIDHIHLPAGKVVNFTRHEKNARYKDKPWLEIADAGISCNIPLMPLFARNIDIYFICDISALLQKQIFNDLEILAEQAKEGNYPFPQIDYSQLKLNECNIIADDIPNSPILFYFPFSYPFQTTKLQYSEQEFSYLFNNVKKATLASKELILQRLAPAESMTPPLAQPNT